MSYRESVLAFLRARLSHGQLERIRPEYADVLRRVDIEEEPLSSVAEALGITVNNATVRLHRARKAFREQLQAFCGTASMRACLDCACNDRPNPWHGIYGTAGLPIEDS